MIRMQAYPPILSGFCRRRFSWRPRVSPRHQLKVCNFFVTLSAMWWYLELTFLEHISPVTSSYDYGRILSITKSVSEHRFSTRELSLRRLTWIQLIGVVWHIEIQRKASGSEWGERDFQSPWIYWWPVTWLPFRALTRVRTSHVAACRTPRSYLTDVGEGRVEGPSDRIVGRHNVNDEYILAIETLLHD